MNSIKVGFLISYDYEFVKISLPRVYDFVNEIFFAVDIDRRTWSGEELMIPEEFWQWIKEFDTEHKITIYEDQFYMPDLSPMECDTRERNMLGKRMGKCDWYIQIDSDEYFVDFGGFIQKLKNYNANVPTSIYCNVVTLFKEISSGYLLIDAEETLSFATNNPVYDLARNNTSGNVHIHWNDLVLHQSWARSPSEIYLKLRNWSHKNDFNTTSFFNLWNAVDEFNYFCLANFHPLNPISWTKLQMVPGSMVEILDSMKNGRKDNAVVIPLMKKKSLLSRLWKEIRSKD